MTTVHDSRPLSELAMEYVLLTTSDHRSAKDTKYAHLLFETIVRRAGYGPAEDLLGEARDILKMVGA